MSEMSKELLRNYVMEQNFTNANEVLYALKGLFRDILQEVLEAELDETLGYSKNDISAKSTNMNNSRNGYSKKTIKSELGPISLNVPRDRNGEFEPQIVPKHQRNINGIEEKVLALYSAH